MQPFETGARTYNNNTLLETLQREDAAKNKSSNKLFGGLSKLGINKEDAQSSAAANQKEKMYAKHATLEAAQVGKTNSIMAGLMAGNQQEETEEEKYKKRVENAALPEPPTYRGLVKNLSPALDQRLAGARRKQRHTKFVEPERAKNPSFDHGENLAYAMHMPADFDDPGLEETVKRLEQMQNAQFTAQQPNSEQNQLISRVLSDRPEWRQRMAVSYLVDV